MIIIKAALLQLLFFYICHMNKKWYFGIFITMLALLVVAQQQTVVPNQEIVLEFTNRDIASSEIQYTITTIKQKLQSIGVKNTKISDDVENGTLKITYYSNEDVSFVKSILSDSQVALSHILFDQNEDKQNTPEDQDSKEFSLNVYEIQQGGDADSDFNGTLVIEVKQEQSAKSNPNVYEFAANYSIDRLHDVNKAAQKVNRYIVLAINHDSHKIPEVRAGPNS